MEITNTSFGKIKEKEFPEEILIINADDLGICIERDSGIFELFEKKVISSASIMVNGASFESAVKKARELRLTLGIHLNLTEGEPINKSNIEFNTLVKYDNNTRKYIMHGKFGFRELLKAKKINMSLIKNELIHQVKLMLLRYYYL
jgi:predicted glycoside hydrolase/deacetylase ChbG (UPF0249 family)